MSVPMLYRTEILRREGWSRSLMIRLLGEPDRTLPCVGHQNPSFLYRLDRVLEAEASSEFLAAQETLARRREAWRKGTAARNQE